jgi:perosamine synthetase
MNKKLKILSEPNRGSLFGSREIDVIKKVIKSKGSLTRGKEIEKFEKDFTKLTKSKYAIAVTSCSAALRIAFQILNLNKNDEVIIPVNAFWNSVNPIIESGAKIKVADVIPYNLTICPNSIKSLISKKTKAILILNYAGISCNFDEINKIIKKTSIKIIEDAAHATGTYYKKMHVGNKSDISCFSFSTLKNISTLGEGGMIVTSNKYYAKTANMLRNCYPIGKKKIFKKIKHHYNLPNDTNFLRPGDNLNSKWSRLDILGSRYTMNSVSAAVGSQQLKSLNKFIEHRIRISEIYNKWVMSKPNFEVINITPRSNSSWHLYVFFIKKKSKINRNIFVEKLSKKYKLNIVNRYWPINDNSIMKFKKHSLGEAPVYENHWFNEMVSLPISQAMKINDAKEIVRRLEKTYLSMSIK